MFHMEQLINPIVTNVSHGTFYQYLKNIQNKNLIYTLFHMEQLHIITYYMFHVEQNYYIIFI